MDPATILITAAAVASALGVLWALSRKLVRRARNATSKVGAAVDSLLGRDAIVHPDTGVVLVPATPGLGMRLAGIEQQQSDLSAAIAQLARTQSDVAGLTKQVSDLASAFHMHSVHAEEHDREVWAAIRDITARIPVPPAPPSEHSDAA